MGVRPRVGRLGRSAACLARMARSAACLALVAALALAFPGSSAAWNNGLARTPPMGFSTWNALGCTNYTETDVKEIADRLVSSGMAAAGYRLLILDDCWMASSRDGAGNLIAPPSRFPDGMKALVDYVHSKGLEFGIYEDAGTHTCQGLPGSYGHEAQDARLFASWGVDYLKYDWCYVTHPASDPVVRDAFAGESAERIAQSLYTRMRNAIVAAGRPMIFEMCTGWDSSIAPPAAAWAPPIANVWRTTADIRDRWPSVVHNFKHNAAYAQFAGPGAFNDPDLLEVGNGGMTVTDYQSQVSLWAIMAAPLIVSSDIRSDGPQALRLLLKRSVIAVDQDPLGRQGAVISHSGKRWVLLKPLSGGDIALALFNQGRKRNVIGLSFREAGLSPTRRYVVRNLWTGRAIVARGAYVAKVRPHATMLLRVSALG